MQKKYVLVPAAALALGAGVLFVTSDQVSAHGFGGGDGSLVQRLAEALGKSEAEVQGVFDQMKEEHQAEREAHFSVKLDEAVANGQLTAEQKQLLLDRHQELKAEREAMKDQWQSLSKEERRARKQTHRDEMQRWAEEQGIDLSVLDLGRDGPLGGHHFGRENR